MSLPRSVDVRNASSGQPATVVIQTRQEVSFTETAVTLLSTHDDGSKITAVIQHNNGIIETITLWASADYQPIQNFTDGQVNNQIQNILNP